MFKTRLTGLILFSTSILFVIMLFVSAIDLYYLFNIEYHNAIFSILKALENCFQLFISSQCNQNRINELFMFLECSIALTII